MLSSKLLFILAASLARAQQDLVSILNANPSLSMLRDTILAYPNIVTALGAAENITVLAPSNEAFETWMNSSSYQMAKGNDEAIQALLTYHVLNGTYASSAVTEKAMFLPTILGDYEEFRNLSGKAQVVQVNAVDDSVVFTGGLKMESKVTTADVEFTGGVAHIIDHVLAPPMGVSETAGALKLNSLVSSLKAAGLVETVDSLAGVTIFAPNDAAFKAIASVTANLSKADLGEILTYHVVPNVVGYSTGLKNNQELTTVQGAKLTIRIEDDSVFVNGAKVVIADVLTNNGVVHVLDGVLNFNATDDMPDASAETQVPAFTDAAGTPTETDADAQQTGAASKWGVSVAAIAAAVFAFGMA